MKLKTCVLPAALSLAVLMSLTACGGDDSASSTVSAGTGSTSGVGGTSGAGGASGTSGSSGTGGTSGTSGTSGTGGSSGTPALPGSPTAATVPGTLAVSTYAAGSPRAVIFSRLNAFRQQCGFPALQQNTTLDRAAYNHAKYAAVHPLRYSAYVNSETPGIFGFSGDTYYARAIAAGAPANLVGGGVGAYPYSIFPPLFSESDEVNKYLNSILSSPYQQSAAMAPIGIVGIGESREIFAAGGNAFLQALISMMIFDTAPAKLANAPLTFPCEGVAGVPASGAGPSDEPVPPLDSRNDMPGAPITVQGNLGDTVLVTSATVTGPAGAVSVLILNGSADPNHVLSPSTAVVYSAQALVEGTQYSVSLSGTINGTPFIRAFSFTPSRVR